MNMRCLFIRLCLSAFLAITCAAKQPPVPRVVDLKATDGTPLKATYFAAGKPGPGVLLLHQCNRQRKVWDGLAQGLAAVGINVLTLDFRGFGESGGTPFNQLTPGQATQELASKWPDDVDTALHYLKSQPGVKPSVIGVGGASCGVNQSIQAARRHPEVKSLVLLSGPTDRPGRKFLQESNLPAFMAAADDDEFSGTVETIEWLYSVSGNPGSRFVHFKTGGHGADMFAVQKELAGMIVDWYVTTLVKTPGRAPLNKAAQGAKKQSVLALIDEPGGPAKVAQTLADLRQRDPKASLFPEAVANLLGYEHLQTGDVKGGVEIMKLNADAYPDSPNVYDSLADAYLADGQKDLARQYAQKALDLLPSDTVDPQARRDAIRGSAEQKLK